MPRFFFHLFNSIDARDREGRELPDLAAATGEAVTDIQSIISGDAKDGRVDLRGRIEIAGADGATLKTVRFTDAVVLSLPEPARD